MFMGAANDPSAMERDGKALAGLLLTDEAASQVLSGDQLGSTRWRGENEFEKASGETLFFSKYAPLIRQAAPRPPFRFVYSFAVGLPAYDKNNPGFPLTLDAGTLTGLIGQGNLIAELQFSWPDVFWKLTPKDAETLFADLKRNQAPNGRPELRFAAEIEAVSLDPATRKLRLQLRSLKLYTPDFRRLVHEFPVINDAASFATSRPPRALRLPTPVVLDEIAQCAEVIAALGDKAPENLIKRCFALVAERDASFYAHGGASAALAPNDARLPFFPRSGPTGSRSEAAAFIAWAKSYAAGVPDTVQTSPIGPSGSEQNGDVTFAAVARGAYGQGLPGAALEAEGLQADQIVPYGRLEQVDLLMALPNRAQSYGVSVPKSAFGAAQGATAQSVIRIGKPRALTGKSGAPLVLMDVTPLRTVVSANGNIIGARNYQDVARLGEGFANPPPTAPHPMAKGPIRLDAPFIDLLIASTVGDQLSRRSLAHMVLRRWALENPPAYRGPRFFVPGKRAPNPQEAASLRPDFIQWATAIVPALPLDVVTSSPIEIRANQSGARWGDLPCFSGSYDSIMQDLNRTMAANAGAASCERGAETLTSDEQRACAAARAITRTEDYLRQVGGECQARDALSSFADPLSVVVRLAHDLPAPSLSLLEDRAKLIAAVTLKLAAIKISDAPPAAADVLPEIDPRPEAGAAADGRAPRLRHSRREVSAGGLSRPAHGGGSRDAGAGPWRRRSLGRARLRRGGQGDRQVAPDPVDALLARPGRNPARHELRRGGSDRSPAHAGRQGLSGDARDRSEGSRRIPQSLHVRQAVRVRGRARDDRSYRRTARRAGQGSGCVAPSADRTRHGSSPGDPRGAEGEIWPALQRSAVSYRGRPTMRYERGRPSTGSPREASAAPASTDTARRGRCRTSGRTTARPRSCPARAPISRRTRR